MKSFRGAFGRLVLVAAWSIAGWPPPASAEDAAPKRVASVHLARTSLERYSRLDVTVALSAEYDDPFDADEIRVDALIELPGGDGLTLPCFYESGEPGSSRWGARFTPSRLGRHALRIRVLHQGAEETSERLAFNVRPSMADGFLRRAADNPYAFVHDSGRPFRGIGINFGWESRRRRASGDLSGSYESMFETLSELRANLVRTWMCPWNLPLEWNTVTGGRYRDDERTYNRSAIERLDALLDLAARHGIYVVLVLDYHGALKTKADYWGGNNHWSSHPYNRARGGPCDSPAEFFTHPEARRLYKNRLRYLVARWGYSPFICAWELWNEIDHVMEESAVPPETIVEWHREMAEHLGAIDPYRHLVTTSVSQRAIPGLFSIEAIDFSQAHLYGETAALREKIEALRREHEKPAVVGEFARDWRSPRDDTAGDFERELHLGLWRGLFSPTPILPLTWWWGHFERRGALARLRHLAAFQERIDLAGGPVEERPVAGVEALETRALAAGGDVFAWVRNAGELALEAPRISISRAPAGRYRIRVVDTRKGDEIASFEQETTEGRLDLALAALGPGRDVALEITPADAFTLVVLPDTQCYADTRLGQSALRWGKDLRQYFFAQTKWIRDDAERRNIRFVVHEGDITQTDHEEEWEIARKAMATLDGKVPYCLCLGNHDMGYRKTEGSPTSYATAVDRQTLFNRYFPRADHENRPSFGGTHRSTLENSYHFFEGGDMRFMVLSLEFKPRDEVLEWANQVVGSHPEHRVIVLTHAYLGEDGRRIATDAYPVAGNTGEAMWQKLVSRHANIFLVLCGHRLGEARLTSVGEHGNAVHQLLCDYQGLDDGGASWLRYLTFYPGSDRIRVRTYNPHLDRHRLDPAGRFDLEYEMAAAAARRSGAGDGR